MAAKEYCNQHKCCDCIKTCFYDQRIPCSLDCENLTEDGNIKIISCLMSGCEEVKYIFDMVNSTGAEITAKYGEIAKYPY